MAFTGRAASSEEKNKTKNTSFDSVFQNPCCVSGGRALCFVPVEILPLCGSGTSVCFSKFSTAYFQHFPSLILPEKEAQREESKESEMTPSEGRGIVLLFAVLSLFPEMLFFWT